MLIGSRQSQVGWSFAATLAALALVGCGGGSGGRASASFAFSIYDINDTAYATPLTCDEVAGSQFALTLIERDTGYEHPSVATAACPRSGSTQTLFYATTSSVPTGYYDVAFDLYGNLGVYKTSTAVIGSSETNTGFFLTYGLNDFSGTREPVFTQSFRVDWRLYSDSLGAYTDCNAGEAVDLEFSKPGSEVWITSTFPCTDDGGYSFPIPTDYTSVQWNMYLRDTATQRDVGTVHGSVVSIPANADIELGTQTIHVY